MTILRCTVSSPSAKRLGWHRRRLMHITRAGRPRIVPRRGPSERRETPLCWDTNQRDCAAKVVWKQVIRQWGRVARCTVARLMKTADLHGWGVRTAHPHNGRGDDHRLVQGRGYSSRPLEGHGGRRIRNPLPGFDIEFATLCRDSWYKTDRIMEQRVYVSSAEYEAQYLQVQFADLVEVGLNLLTLLKLQDDSPRPLPRGSRY